MVKYYVDSIKIKEFLNGKKTLSLVETKISPRNIFWLPSTLPNEEFPPDEQQCLSKPHFCCITPLISATSLRQFKVSQEHLCVLFHFKRLSHQESSFSLCLFSQLTLEGGKFDYFLQIILITAWAEKTNLCPQNKVR